MDDTLEIYEDKSWETTLDEDIHSVHLLLLDLLLLYMHSYRTEIFDIHIARNLLDICKKTKINNLSFLQVLDKTEVLWMEINATFKVNP